MNLTYCPEGGEHEWELWYHEDEAVLIIDCDRCHQEAHRGAMATTQLRIVPLPVELIREGSMLFVKPRREV